MGLCGCLKIGMRERNLEDRLVKAGAEVSHERIAPMLRGGTSAQLGGIGTVLFAPMGVSDYDKETGETAEHQDMLYVIFAKTDEAATWAEDRAGEWLQEERDLRERGEEDEYGDVAPEWDLDHWNIYRYDRVVMCGHFRILSVAKMY